MGNRYTLLLFPHSFQKVEVSSKDVLPLTAAMISSATHTGDNEFDLDGMPLGQVGKGLCGVWGGESEEGGGDGGTVSMGSSQ